MASVDRLNQSCNGACSVHATDLPCKGTFRRVCIEAASTQPANSLEFSIGLSLPAQATNDQVHAVLATM
jgi:hypothetical protein